MIKLITFILEKLFPFQDINDKPSVFIQDSWLVKNTRPLQVKEYLWTPSKG